MDSTTWEQWESAAVVAARELQPGDTILSHPEAGPFGPWEVREVRGAYMSTSRVDIVSDGHTWFGAEGEQTFRVEREPSSSNSHLDIDGRGASHSS